MPGWLTPEKGRRRACAPSRLSLPPSTKTSMAQSAEFDFAPLTIPLGCLRAMRGLTLSGREWGGRLVPKQNADGSCQLSCDITLIKGTGLETDNPDARYYIGDGEANKNKAVAIASTPLYEEVFSQARLCKGKKTVNLFFHTHPLHLLSTDDLAVPVPPSMGDIFAHCVLAMHRNYMENKQLNTMLVMGFEGLYVYGVYPHRFRQDLEHIDALSRAWLTKNPGKQGRKALARGELPAEITDVLKGKVFDALRNANKAMFVAFKQLQARNARELSIAGAPIIDDGEWKCRNCKSSYDFEFARELDSDQEGGFRATFLDAAENNAFQAALNENGFFYHLYPAPFDSAITLPGATQATLLESRPVPTGDPAPTAAGST